MSQDHPLLLAYYADDFTGATDAMEQLTIRGVKTVLFIKEPSQSDLDRFKSLQAFGIAGNSRVMSPVQMREELPTPFEALLKSGAAHVHYKVCSTFDSSTKIGSIGTVIDIAFEMFKNRFIPVLVAAPSLGRFSAFGNLFARMGIGSKGAIYRLDRHPSMSKHPTTPSDEGDLTLHLSKQTDKAIGLINVLDLDTSENDLQITLKSKLEESSKVIYFDTINQEHLKKIGNLLNEEAKLAAPLFSVGSSAIESALTSSWKEKGWIEHSHSLQTLKHNGPILVISGSCSPVSQNQIKYAIENGFEEVCLQDGLSKSANRNELVDNCVAKVQAAIAKGKSAVVHTMSVSMDAITQGPKSESAFKTDTKKSSAEVLGSILGTIALKAAEQGFLRRIVIAGGDTSSFAARAMGIEAVEMVAPLSLGAPLCRAYTSNAMTDGLEVNFKGGQVGEVDYFMLAQNGTDN